MTRFLVEAYEPGVERATLGELAGRIRRAADELRGEGVPIEHVRTVGVPEDDTCFHFLEGPSAAAVGEATRRAGLAFTRIVEAVE